MATDKGKPLTSHKHDAATRPNNPDSPNAAFVPEEAPQTLALVTPEADPTLQWAGKPEPRSAAADVPVVPIYIQERIAPRAILEAFREHVRGGDEQLSMFEEAETELQEFAQRIAFYQYADKWMNRLILGDSLQVMASLEGKEGLGEQVQMIYMDPPYGINFGSNWQVSTASRSVRDGKLEYVTQQPEQIKAFRDTWSLGVHSYLTYLYERLLLAHRLLTPSGSVFVQIGDANAHVVRCVLDEVFGAENSVATIVVQKTTSDTGTGLSQVCDYVLWYSKNGKPKYRALYLPKQAGGDGAEHYNQVEFPDGTRRAATPEERTGRVALPEGARLYTASDLQSAGEGRAKGEGAACWFEVRYDGRSFWPTEKSRWKTNEEGMARLIAAGRVVAQANTLRYVRYLDDFQRYALTNIWSDVGGAPNRAYVVETTPKVIERCLLMTTDPGDLVLDPTCGGGTTPYVAEQWGRRWIGVDTSRVALALSRARLMGARYRYYTLRDSVEGQRLTGETGGDLPRGDVSKGFVYRTERRITLESIVRQQAIQPGITREEARAAVEKGADAVPLYDLPHENRGWLRVTGPFTVESLTPHRVLPADSAEPTPAAAATKDRFEERILENLRVAGVQNTRAEERLVFADLSHHAGEWIQGAGAFENAGGAHQRVAVAIGPEHGTVGPEYVREAAKEAVRGLGFDVLVVCGFAFDPAVVEQASQDYGPLRVVVCRMSAELWMGTALLEESADANLFTVFGEPDIEVVDEPGGRVRVTVLGVDIYDPTTGAVRSSSTDEIACWFIDTNYDQEQFIVRHAYFTGGGRDPYRQLKAALKAEVDKDAWEALYSDTSRPFPRPSRGRIAVKVINHYGDEVLKVIPIGSDHPA